MYAQKKLTPFEQALVDSVLMEYQTIPPEEDLPDRYSEGFRQWADQLICKTRRTGWYYVNTVAKKVILVAILLGLLTITVVAVRQVRQTSKEFINHGDRYGVIFDQNEAATAPRTLETVYHPAYIPRGFRCVKESASIGNRIVLWENGAGQWIIYDQMIIPQTTSDSWIGIDAEHSTVTEWKIGGYLVTEFRWSDSYLLMWTADGYFFSLELPNSVSDRAMERIFLSIQPVAQ